MSLHTPHKQSRARQAGFSLVEVLVSLSIFTIVVTISVGTLLVLIDANTKSQAMQVVMTNLSFALDSMTREIRTGDSYWCGSDGSLPNDGESTRDCPGGASAMSFNEGGNSITSGAGSSRIAYRLNTNTDSIERRLGTQSSWVPVTSPDVNVDTFELTVTGSDRNDEYTPAVTIYVAGRVGEEDGIGSDFNVETTVSQILLDVP